MINLEKKKEKRKKRKQLSKKGDKYFASSSFRNGKKNFINGIRKHTSVNT